MNILLMGYYGKSNIGDDLFVRQLVSYFSRQPDVKRVRVLCDEDYYDVETVAVDFIPLSAQSKLKTLLAIWQSDVIFWGGGTLNLGENPDRLLKIQKLARLLGKQFGFLGIGLENANMDSNPKALALFGDADFLYLRDVPSYNLASQILDLKSPCCLGGDLALLNLNLYQDMVSASLPSQQFANISFSGKYWWGQGRAEFYASQFMPLIEKYGSVIHFLPAHVGKIRNDNTFHQRVQAYLPEEHSKIHQRQRPEEFLEVLSGMDFHIGNRLHSIIAADILGKPNIGIGKTGKITNYVEKSGMLAAERVVEFMEPIALERIEDIAQRYKQPVAFMEAESLASQACLKKALQRR